MVAITMIICVSVVVSIAIFLFGSFCQENPDKAAMMFRREDNSGILKIRLNGKEKKRYREFIFRR